jgi:hypothetical protein
MAEVKTVMPIAQIEGGHRPVGDYHGDIPRDIAVYVPRRAAQ